MKHGRGRGDRDRPSRAQKDEGENNFVTSPTFSANEMVWPS